MPDTETLFPSLDSAIRPTLDALPDLIEKVFPLPGRFRSGLPEDVAELSRLLTSERGERSRSYLGRPNLLSAYLRYFLPWNVYRLSRLLPALDLPLVPGSAVTDLGSGPFTLPIALWISRPDLRNIPLEFRCTDQTGSGLEAGKKLFAALCAAAPPLNAGAIPWTIRTIRAPLNAPINGPRAALTTAINLFNELIPPSGALGSMAAKYAALLSSLTAESGSILIMEPGVPRSGEFITALRRVLIEHDRPPRAPCPHHNDCCFPGGRLSNGGKQKWCHFAFDTTDAPSKLLSLSAAAGIPKERAVMSFLFAGAAGKSGDMDSVANTNTTVVTQKTAAPDGTSDDAFPVRIVSDPFPLAGHRFGRYGCSVKGMVLAAGSMATVETLLSGTLLHLPPSDKEKRDAKSGALIMEIG
ncbi:hypothetical protein FACS1894141_0050 [Spirochaetia bacterium]|nr:hypothetical protein FACS1894141_0050 [Spirochaetia bacterium]